MKYLSDPKSVPQSWEEFFNGLDDDREVIKKEILGPSWARKKIDFKENEDLKAILKKVKIYLKIKI